MSFAMGFTPTSMTTAKYDEVMRRLEAAGVGMPDGRLYHVCYGDPNGLRVVDVWETMEKFDAFGAVLLPILSSLGIDVGTPDVREVHNIVEG